MINLSDFLENKTISHSESASNLTEGLKYFIENEINGVDAITYNSIRQFSIANIGVLEKDENEHFFYEYTIERTSDIVDNISLECSENLKAVLSYNIGGKFYEKEQIKKIIFIAAPYTEFKIRITFLEKPKNEDTFNILMRNYIWNSQDRKLLAQSKVKCDNNLYFCGMFSNE